MRHFCLFVELNVTLTIDLNLAATSRNDWSLEPVRIRLEFTIAK